MKIINIIDLINDENNKIQIGIDKNNEPVYLGDIVYEDIEEWFSDDYFNGYEPKMRPVQPSEKRLCKGRVYRKAIFENAEFCLVRVKEEGDIPMGTSGKISATENNLKKYKKVN